MAALRTLLASLLVLAAGVAALAVATDGFQAFTSEAARRINVREEARPIPSVTLQTASGRIVEFADLRGSWLLVDFIYTRCTTYCSAQGSTFSRLQERLARLIAGDEVTLLSISFDPKHDTPARLTGYKRRFGDSGTGWIAARPTKAPGLDALLRAFSVTAIPDRFGGYVHNAAIWVVDPRGRLVAIFDWDAPAQAAGFVRHRLAG